MFLLRNALQKDIDQLYDLSLLGNFLNLPQNKEKILSLVVQSEKSFAKPSRDFSENYYFFVLEDLKSNKIIGTSSIHAQHGTLESPHFYLKVGKERKYSSTIDKYFVHKTLKLGIDINGPSEIGGLVLHPDYRGNPSKLGKQISFVRFLFMAKNPDQFKEVIHSELLPPFDEKGNSPLWEAIGRKFFHLGYQEADELSRVNKEFIINLFPSENIYSTLLPLEAQRIIGQVNNQTKPVKRMLEEIGFKYNNEIDPFDGGPHYRCSLVDIKPIKNSVQKPFQFSNISSEGKPFLVLLNRKSNSFSATQVLAKEGDTFTIDKNFENIKNDLRLTKEGHIFAIPLFY